MIEPLDQITSYFSTSNHENNELYKKTKETVDKVNEIIDYLSDKEASKGECDHPDSICCKNCYPPQQEECTKCGKKMEGMYCCDLSPQEALDIIKDVKPEEFVGECLTCGNPVRSGSTKEVCVCPERKPDGSWKPQLKDELRDGGICLSCGETMWVPKSQMAGAIHDKCKLKEESPKEDEWDKETEKQWQYKLQTGFIDVSELKWFINRNFVSKVKIKTQYNRQVCANCKHVECKELTKFVKSLGLEEL